MLLSHPKRPLELQLPRRTSALFPDSRESRVTSRVAGFGPTIIWAAERPSVSQQRGKPLGEGRDLKEPGVIFLSQYSILNVNCWLKLVDLRDLFVYLSKTLSFNKKVLRKFSSDPLGSGFTLLKNVAWQQLESQDAGAACGAPLCCGSELTSSDDARTPEGEAAASSCLSCQELEGRSFGKHELSALSSQAYLSRPRACPVYHSRLLSREPSFCSNLSFLPQATASKPFSPFLFVRLGATPKYEVLFF